MWNLRGRERSRRSFLKSTGAVVAGWLAARLSAAAMPFNGLIGVAQGPAAEASDRPLAGADELTPSTSMFYGWLNGVWKGPNEQQTLANLDFFRWLYEEFGMRLDIYAFDAYTIDLSVIQNPAVGGWRTEYGSLDSPWFRENFPRGFDPVVLPAKAFGARLGIWIGPDGFGNTPQDEKARHDTLVRLCRDYGFQSFKFDLVAGSLRPEKQDALVRTLVDCRKYCSDLITMNERLEVGKATPYMTTWLWESAESYIDVYQTNTSPAPHHRVKAISRGLVPNLQRLAEDNGTCFSSCLDYWEDDMILQAFNRSLILSPQLYGNPWLMRDDEYPRFARFFNLSRRYKDLLVQGMTLPKERYGPYAVSRGDSRTRLLTLRNLDWTPVTYTVSLDPSIGLTAGGEVEVVRFHPSERRLGRFSAGGQVRVEVPPFRAALLMISADPISEVGVTGCDYEVVRDVAGRPVELKLLGLPGTVAQVKLENAGKEFSRAELVGKRVPQLLNGKSIDVRFPGEPLRHPCLRKLADLKEDKVPAEAETLYEATCFTADNNALEVRCLRRSGPTAIPQVQRARDGLVLQPCFIDIGAWDRYAFDGNPQTAFRMRLKKPNRNASLRVDLGEPVVLDKMMIRMAPPFSEPGIALTAETSSDLRSWTAVIVAREGANITLDFSRAMPVRYLRLYPTPSAIAVIEGYHEGKLMDRSSWRASNLFDPYSQRVASQAWTGSLSFDEAVIGSYLVVAIHGEHDEEGAYAALRIGEGYMGAPDRAPSFPFNPWESMSGKEVRTGYTYYFPVDSSMIGKSIEAVVLGFGKQPLELRPEVWIATMPPAPYREQMLVLHR